MDSKDAKLGLGSIAIHADGYLNETSAVVAPIYQSATFKAASAEEFAQMATDARHNQFYTRYGNPTHGQTAAVIAALEGTEAAMMMASGMGAISTATLTFVRQGDHVIGQTNHYGGTTAMLRDLLPRLGIDVTVVDQTDVAAFESALKPATKLIIVESPSNPAMRLTDLRAVSTIAKPRGIITMIDNTFATPVNQRPAALGIDLIAHSATKFMGGHSDIIAGAVAGSAAHLDKIWETSLILGSVLGPMDSWLLLRGLRTLPLRVEKHNRSALAIAGLLESRSEVKAVNYPGLESHPQHELARQQMSGFGGILSFELNGGVDAAERFISNMTLASRAASVGGHETLVVRPAAMLAHQVSEEEFIKTGVNPGLIRLSVGLEDERDLLNDIKQALQS